MTIEIDTDYFIEKTILKMVKSRYTNLDKNMEGNGFSFNYVSKWKKKFIIC